MYTKLLFNSLATISLIALPVSNIATASTTEKNQSKKPCGTEVLKSQNKLNKLPNYDFDKYLQFQVVGSQIVAKFTPQDQQNQPIDIDTLAKAAGYESFNWVSYVEQDPYGIADHRGQLLSLPYNDPPLGGYQYGLADNHPFYWDIEKCQNCHSRYYHKHPRVQQKFVLTFEDSPSDYRLKPGETINFVTHLVGIKQTGNSPQWDVLSTFTWQLTNNATGHGQVSLTAVSLDISELSPSVVSLIKKDGGIVSTEALAQILGWDKDNPHTLQCQLQNHQSQRLDTHL
jgi:hypothetical protein